MAGNRPANWALLVGLHALPGGLVCAGLQDAAAKAAPFVAGALAGVVAAAVVIKLGRIGGRIAPASLLGPFVLVFSPSLLLVAKGFNRPDFWITFVGCVLDITSLAAALSR